MQANFPSGAGGPTRVPVVIAHYHARTGGVTTVMRRHALALRALGVQVSFLLGEEPPDDRFWQSFHYRVLPGFGYRDDPPDLRTVAGLAGQVRGLAAGAVLHVHNPYLGKNPGWPAVWRQVLDAGQPVVFHVHDFAEDGRPQLLHRFSDRSDWYPHADNARWLVLNAHDAAVLAAAGIPRSHLAVAPNPVEALGLETLPEEPGLLWYQARPLARKNLGEFLFWAKLARPPARFLLTAPVAGTEQSAERARWETLAHVAGISVNWTSSAPRHRPELCLTTSVKEGFGYAFAEPWLDGIPVCGRMLPSAMQSLLDAGVRFPAGYLSLHAGNGPDFGCLGPEAQESILRKPADELRAVSWVRDASGKRQSACEWLALARSSATKGVVMENRRCIRRTFAPDRVADWLAGIHAQAGSGKPGCIFHADFRLVAEAFERKNRVAAGGTCCQIDTP